MRKKVSLALLLLVLLVCAPLLVRGVQTYRQSIWDGQSHINIALDNGDIALWSIEPQEKKATVMVIPQNTSLTVSTAYGDYTARAIGKLSFLERKDGSLVKDALVKTLFVPVDGVVVRKRGEEAAFDMKDFIGIPGLVHVLTKRPWGDRVSNFTWYDMVRLWFFSFSIKPDEIKTVNLAETSVVSEEDQPDGTKRFIVDSSQFSVLAQKYFLDQRLKNENLTVEIINGTGSAGAANNLALLVSNIGGTVINTTKSEERIENTRIYTKERGYTAEKISRMVGGTLVLESPKDSRADILVVLGGE